MCACGDAAGLADAVPQGLEAAAEDSSTQHTDHSRTDTSRPAGVRRLGPARMALRRFVEAQLEEPVRSRYHFFNTVFFTKLLVSRCR